MLLFTLWDDNLKTRLAIFVMNKIHRLQSLPVAAQLLYRLSSVWPRDSVNKSAHFCAGVHVSKSYSRYTDVNVFAMMFALGVGSRYAMFTVSRFCCEPRKQFWSHWWVESRTIGSLLIQRENLLLESELFEFITWAEFTFSFLHVCFPIDVRRTAVSAFSALTLT